MITQTLGNLSQHNDFIQRHIGPNSEQQQQMLSTLGVNTLEALIEQTIPAGIRRQSDMGLKTAIREHEALAELKALANKNILKRSLLGMGYSDTITPPVILRNILENPGWYTAYTPYQPEISQGRLEALLNFQQVIIDLTKLELANASLLDEATACAEAMAMCKRVVRKNKSNIFAISEKCHPQNIAVVKTRAESLDLEVVVGDIATLLDQHQVFGVLLQYPDTEGLATNPSDIINKAHEQNAKVVMSCDLLSLCVLTPPGELGADIAVGSAQRFGVPLGFGGPHAAFMSTSDEFKRSMPGRIIGVSIDRQGRRALRMAMQTREQHIRREKATSNICTAQALLAIMASSYAVYHGPKGLLTIASRVHRLAAIFAQGLINNGFAVVHNSYFDTVSVLADNKDDIQQQALAAGFNLRINGEMLSVAFDEKSNPEELVQLWQAFGISADVDSIDANLDIHIEDSLLRKSTFLEHPSFNSHHSETEMLRYLKQLEDKDVALNRSMIALGSCTMKLNAVAEMIPVTWPEFAYLHPFAPAEQSQGYREMFTQLEEMLCRCTGYDAISLQPNAGSQGEYAGLMAIKRFHESNNQGQRNICLIPSSAHGTNPASAAMANMKVVIVKCDDNGNVDLNDLKEKAERHSNELAAVMVTYPSTHGVFEEGIQELCDIIHSHGGQVYVDGANLNALVGLAAPGLFGADVSHLNLHKTFCIPHGGGGPGMGPIGVKQHLADFLPSHPLETLSKTDDTISAAPWGSAAILPISWMYIRMMGDEGLKQATSVAILNANYIAKRLEGAYPILYTGSNGRVAHECLVDIRPLKESSGISEEDIAKRLIDFGFHAPTMSFPVAGTLMIEPTESENKAELDRFCDALLKIREEAAQVEQGILDAEINPLKMAPHSADEVVDMNWDRPYSREQAVYPTPWVKANKYWPPVNRIDNVYGDRNLFCACPPIESWEE